MKLLLASLAMIIVVETAVSHMAAVVIPEQSRVGALTLVGLVRCVEILLMLGLARFFVGGPGGVGLDPEKAASGLKTGLIWSALFGMAVFGIAGVAYLFSGIHLLKMVAADLPEGAANLILLFVVGGFLGPIAEEIFFRGICYGYFRKYGVLSAIIITTGVFVVAHAVKNTLPIPQIAGGIVFALSYEYSRSLVTPIIIHISGNLAIFSLSFLF